MDRSKRMHIINSIWDFEEKICFDWLIKKYIRLPLFTRRWVVISYLFLQNIYTSHSLDHHLNISYFWSFGGFKIKSGWYYHCLFPWILVRVEKTFVNMLMEFQNKVNVLKLRKGICSFCKSTRSVSEFLTKMNKEFRMK